MWKPGKLWLTFSALAAVLVILAAACEEEKGEETPTATPAAAETATAAATPTAVAEVPGITNTEILLGADCPVAGTLGAVYATIPQATEA